jgi:hypothetical protein
LGKSISRTPKTLRNFGGIKNRIGGSKRLLGKKSQLPTVTKLSKITRLNVQQNPSRLKLRGKHKQPTFPKKLGKILRHGKTAENHGHHSHRPICLPPIVKCRPPHVCPPCVTSVCPGAQVIIIEQSTEQILTEFLTEEVAPAFVIDLESNTEVSLEIDDLTSQPGALVLEVNGIGLPVDILLWEDGVLDIRVPSVGLSEAQLGKLYVLNSDLQLMAAVDARLHPAAQ